MRNISQTLLSIGRFGALLLAAALCSIPSASHAQNIGYWTGNAATGNWTPSGAAWFNGLEPNGLSHTAYITNDITVNPTISLINGSVTVGILNLGDMNGGNVFTISSNLTNTLNFGVSPSGNFWAGINPQLNKTTGGTDVISAPMAINSGNLTVNVTAGGLNLTGPISGLGGLTKYGSPLLRIAPASGTTNTYTGLTTIANRGADDTGAQVILNAVTGNAIAGDIRIGNADVGGTGFAVLQLDQARNTTTGLDQIANTSVITFAGVRDRWSYLKLMGQNETIGGIQNYSTAGVVENMEGETINSNSILTLNTASDLYYNGFIRNRAGGSGTGTLGITKTGAGTQTLSGGEIRYSGPTSIQQGSLVLENASNFGSNVTAASGATLGLAARGADWTFGRTYDGVGANLAITGNPGTVVGSGNSVTVTQSLTHSGVTSINNATLSLSTGSLASTSGIVLNGGRFSLSATAADRINNAATFTSNGGVVAVSGNGFAESLGALQLASGQTRFTVTGQTVGDTLTFANLSRSAGATANFANAGAGPGTVSFTSVPPTPNGILGGWATFDDDYATLSGSSVVANTTYETALTSSSWAANENVKVTLAGAVATQPGQTIHSLILASDGNGNAATPTRTIDLGTNVLTLASGGLMAVNDNIAIRGNSATPTNGSITSSTGELIVTVNGNTTDLNVFSRITGAVRLVKSGTGLLQLRNGANTFSGGITVNEGFVSFRTQGDLGAIPGIVTADSIILNGGILSMESDAPVASLALSANRGVTLGPAGGIIGLDFNGPLNTENVLTINGKITGSGRLTTAGGGILVLNNAANDFSGGIQIGGAAYTGGGGMVRIGNAGAVPAGTALNVLAGTFEVFGNTVTIASLTGTGDITNGLAATPGKLIVNQTSNTTFSGKLMDKRTFDIGPLQPLSFEKSGIGLLIMTGGSTHTGSTTVSGGVLEVSTLFNGGIQSGVGASSNAASNLVIKNGGALSYAGSTPGTTDRSFTLGAGAEAGTITAKGSTRTAAISLGVVGTSTMAFDGAGPRTLTLAGFNAGDNELNVLVSDLSAAAPTSINKIGSGVWWLRNPGNSYTGLTTIYDGRLVISANNALGAPGAGTSLLGGTLELRGVNYTGLERLAMDGGSVLVTPGTTNTWSGTVSFNKFGTLNVGLGATLNLPGSIQGLGRLIKVGEGTLVLGGDNNPFGGFNSTETEIQAGTLVLDYSSQLNSKLTNGRNLVLGGGRQGATVEISGGASAHREVVGGLVLNTGNSQIIRTSGTSWLQLNNITRQAGSAINFGENDVADTDLRNTNGILGGWATLGGTDWAVNSGVSAVNGTGSYVGSGYLGGNDSWIRGLATVPGGGYLVNQWDSEVADGVNPLKNTNVIANYSPTAGSNTNSLRFNTLASLTQTLQGDNSIVSGGILVTPAVGLNETRLIGSGSILRPGSTTIGSELVVHQNSASGLLEIGSVVANTVYPATLFTGTTSSNTTISGLPTGHAATLSVGMSVTGTNIPAGATITSINTVANTFTISANATGSGPVTNLAFSHNTSVGKLGTGSLLLSGDNTYTGVTAIPVGDLWVRKLANGGLASGIGASSEAAANLVFDGGKLQYSGAPVSINRGFTVNNAGGTLDLMHRTTTLTTTGGVAGAGILSRSGVGIYQLSLATSQSAGGLLGWDLQDGSRTLWDFTADGARRVGDNRFANGNATMTFGGGSLRIDGATVYTNNNSNGEITATRTQTMAGNITVNPGASSVHIVANGTVQPGTNTILWLGNRDSADLVRPGGGTLHIVEDLNTNGGVGVAELRMDISSMNGNTTYVGNRGLGWATYSNIAGRADDFAYWFGNSSSGVPDIVAYGGAGGGIYTSQIVANWGVNTTAVTEGIPNPQVPTPGAGFTNTVIPATAVNIEFIRFASQTASTLNLPQFNVPFGTGFELYGESSILVSSYVGDNVKTIQGNTLSLYPAGGLEASQPFDLYIHNWSEWGPNQGRLVVRSQIVDSSYPQSINLVLSGPGTTDLNPDDLAGNIYTGTTFLNDGYLLLSKDLALPGGIGATGGTSHLRIAGDGVVLLGSNDFRRPLGTTSDAVQFGGSGGFAAIGADRSVNLGGAVTPVGVTWGQGNFIPDSQVFILGAPQSGHTLSFMNPIHLGFKEREILTQNGTAVDDAKLMGALSGGVNGVLNKTGTGRLVLNDAASVVKSGYLGETYVYDGILQIETDTALGSASGGTIVVPRTVNSVAGSTDSTTNLISNLPASLMGTLSVGMKISGTNIPGSATIIGVNPGDNSITISANASGTGNVSDLAFSTVATLEIDGGAGNITNAEPLWISGNGDLNNGVIRNLAGSNVLQGTVTLSGDSVIGTDASTQLTLSGQLTDGPAVFGITKVGAGKLVLDDTAPITKSDYQGSTLVNQGIVQIRTNTALGSAVGGTTVSSGAAVELNPASGSLVVSEAFTISGTGVGGTGSLRNLAGNNEVQANITLAANSSIGVDPSSSLLLSRQVTGGFGLTKLGAGTLTLNDAGAGSPSNYTGLTNVQAGTVVVRTNTALGTTAGGTTISPGASLELNPASGNLLLSEGITLAGTGPSGAGSLRNLAGNNEIQTAVILGQNSSIGVNVGTSLTLSDGLADLGMIRTMNKVGLGSLILTEASTYGGSTTVEAGALVVNNSTGSGTGTGSVTVNSGATLAGNGIVVPNSGASVTISPGATFVVGSLTGSVAEDLAITLSGGGDLVIGGTVEFQIFGNQPGFANPLLENDLLKVGAANWADIVFGSNSVLKVTTALDSTLWNGGDVWRLFDWTVLSGTIPTPSTNPVNYDLPSLGAGKFWDTTQLFTNGTISIVPEPGRLAFILMALVPMILRRRRA